MIHKNVLVTSAGVSTGVNVISALRSSTKYRCCITSADMSKDSAGLYLSDNHYITPSADSLKFFDNLKKLLKKIILILFFHYILVKLNSLRKINN